MANMQDDLQSRKTCTGDRTMRIKTGLLYKSSRVIVATATRSSGMMINGYGRSHRQARVALKRIVKKLYA